MSRVRVLVVEDSPSVRTLLVHLIERDARLEVVAAVESAEAMLECLESAAPDVISLDVRLPGMNGLDATLEVMRRRPTPIVIVAADVNAQNGWIALNALRAGALSVVEKPVGLGHADHAGLAQRLCDQFALMSRVKVVRQTIQRGLSFGSAPVRELGPGERRPVGPYDVLAIVASTGGPNALVQLLSDLGRDFPLPVLLVQHIVGSFVTGFAEWLGLATPFRVRVAQDGDEPRAGTVYLPAAGRHLRLSGGRLRLGSDPALDGQRPSGTLLLRSVAESTGGRAIGVILTGMGSDGAEGLLDLFRAGGHTVAEDSSTAIVYGMPAAAVRLGAARVQLPLPAIGPNILEAMKGTVR